MKLNLRLVLVTIILLRGNLNAQVTFVNLVPNSVCDHKEIPSNSHIDISLSHLPDPCLGFDEFNDLNFDLVFEDNFDSPTMDLNKWMGTFGQHSKKFNDGTTAPGILDFFDGPGTMPENFDLTSSPGTLKLLTKEVTPFMGNVFSYHITGCNPSVTPDYGDCILSDGFPNERLFNYTSGYLQSHRNFKYGYFEMRCNIPTVEGIWPAFWLYRTEGGNRTEIDIFEFTQAGGTCSGIPSGLGDRKMFLTYWDWQGDPSLHPPQICSSVDAYLYNALGEHINYTNAWHTYGLYWDEFKLIWLLDGYPIRTEYQYLAKDPHGIGSTITPIQNCEDLYNAASDDDKEILANYYWPDEQCKLIIDMTVQNLGGVYNPNSSLDNTCTSFSGSKSMEIDYVRVYGIRACNNTGTIYYCSDDPGNVQSYLTATDNLVIAPGCDVIVKNPRPDALAWGDNDEAHYMDATAGNEVSLWPGFWAQEGAEFRASIQDCETADLRHTSNGNDILSSQEIKGQIMLADKLAKQKDSIQNSMILPQTNFEVYPNPTSGLITFETSENLTSATILDITGKIVLDLSSQISNKQGQQTLNLSSLSKGVYVLKISSGTETFLSKKIVLN